MVKKVKNEIAKRMLSDWHREQAADESWERSCDLVAMVVLVVLIAGLVVFLFAMGSARGAEPTRAQQARVALALADCHPGQACGERERAARAALALAAGEKPRDSLASGLNPFAGCICGDDCQCKVGDCPAKCPVARSGVRPAAAKPRPVVPRVTHVSPDGTVNELWTDNIYRPIPGQRPKPIEPVSAPVPARPQAFFAPVPFGVPNCRPGGT